MRIDFVYAKACNHSQLFLIWGRLECGDNDVRLTRAAEYGFRAMRYLCNQPSDEWASTQEIATAEEVPPQFLAKVIQHLVQAQLLESSYGKNGGHRLARPANEISVGDILTAIEGPIVLNRCLHNPRHCGFSSTCMMHPIWAELQDTMNEILARHTLKELAQPAMYVTNHPKAALRRPRIRRSV